MSPLIESPVGVMALLISVVSFWFWLEKKSHWKIFNFLPPLIWIYATPVILSNTGLIPFENAAYDFLRSYGLPIFICLMLIKVDVVGAVRIMGKGVFVMFPVCLLLLVRSCNASAGIGRAFSRVLLS